jgi:light-harvesting complex 1 beta chain
MANNETSNSLTGLTGQEAKEFHRIFMAGFIGFTVIAIIAHFLVWSMFRSWFPPAGGYVELQDTIQHAAILAQNLFS